MRVRFYGVRGSTPTSGRSTVRYGGHTSCVEVRLVDNTVIVFDCGTGLRHLGKDLMRERHPGPYHFMLSHVHWDHIMGLPFFVPAFVPGNRVVIYGSHLELMTPDGNVEVPLRIAGRHNVANACAATACAHAAGVPDGRSGRS